ncbi:hypothetical protein EYR36_002518 [Pleurotus pulmonarius]|nr:hypothetical protein EYR36_002518 [Pleurotus pulmonarius]
MPITSTHKPSPPTPCSPTSLNVAPHSPNGPLGLSIRTNVLRTNVFHPIKTKPFQTHSPSAREVDSQHCLDLLISVAKEKCEFSTMQELNRCRSDLMALEPVASLTQGLAIREFVISVALRLKVSIADRLCDDEKNMSALICLIAKTEELTNQVLLLHGPAAQAVLSLIQEMLDGEALQNEGPVPFRSAIALVVRLALACNQVPANLVIKNVDILRWSPVDGGGSSDIYCGKYQDTAVAIKRLRSRGASPNIFKMVYREALLWRSARHSHVLPFLGLVDIAEFKPNVCIVSPWTSGTVDSFLREYHADPLSCIYDIATGVAYLHRLGIVHGDLRGRKANILVDQKLQIQIADFGLAVLAQFGGMASRGGSTRWMAPELLSCFIPDSVRSAEFWGMSMSEVWFSNKRGLTFRPTPSTRLQASKCRESSPTAGRTMLRIGHIWTKWSKDSRAP